MFTAPRGHSPVSLNRATTWRSSANWCGPGCNDILPPWPYGLGTKVRCLRRDVTLHLRLLF
jgi:hypothetical protein